MAQRAVPLQNYFSANNILNKISSTSIYMNIKIQNKKRRSIRLKGHDYSSSGFYFITICTWKHLHLFGEIQNGRMMIDRYGKNAEKEWFRTVEIRKNIKLHEFVVMPNHLHGIIEIVSHRNVDCRGTAHCAQIKRTPQKEQFGKPSSNTIPSIIRSYKGAVTRQIRELENNTGLNVWQRNYYEHIIRNEESYLKISEYILANPLKWRLDKYFG